MFCIAFNPITTNKSFKPTLRKSRSPITNKRRESLVKSFFHQDLKSSFLPSSFTFENEKEVANSIQLDVNDTQKHPRILLASRSKGKRHRRESLGRLYRYDGSLLWWERVNPRETPWNPPPMQTTSIDVDWSSIFLRYSPSFFSILYFSSAAVTFIFKRRLLLKFADPSNKSTATSKIVTIVWNIQKAITIQWNSN